MASPQPASSAKVILSSPADWETWFTLLKRKATSLEVWEYVDPDTDTVPPKRSEKPKYSDIKEGATRLTDLVTGGDRSLIDLYKMAYTDWQQDEKTVDRVRAALQDVAEYIQSTVATSSILLIKDKTTSREEVQALKAQLAPTDYAAKMLARERYRKMQNIGKSKVETWIQNWERALKEAQLNKLGEVQDEINATYDFLQAVETIFPSFSDHWREKISEWKRNNKVAKIPDGYKIAQNFRDSWRTWVATKSSKSPSNAGAFSAGQSTQGGENTPTLQGQKPPSDREKKKCLCGTQRTKDHGWRTCQYVRHEVLEEPYRSGFKVDDSLVKKMRDNFKREKLQIFVKKVLTESKTPDSSNMTAPEKQDEDSPNAFSYEDTAMPEFSGFTAAPEHAPLIVDTQGSFQSGTYPLRDSDLLDTGTTLHICNSADRFSELHAAPPSDGVFAGKTWIPITQ
jgi:hypothetical protein